MATVVTMPQLGESVVEGTVSRWLKQPGEAIAKFEPLLEITTDKIDTEIPSPAAGTLLEIIAVEGETIAVGGVLAHIGEAGEVIAQSAGRPVGELDDEAEGQSGSKTVQQLDSEVVGPTDDQMMEKPSGRAFISPVVARIAREHAVDLAVVPGTGLGGRITKKDILAFVAEEDGRREAEDGRQKTGGREYPEALKAHNIPDPSGRIRPTSGETLQPLTPMRQAIAQHMVLSKQTSPHVTTVYEVDMTAVVRHREANKQHFAEKGITLTFTPYFVAAVTAALRDVPEANSQFTEEGLLVRQRIHIGMAVSLADGLIVPVIRDTDEKNLQGLARAVNDLAADARSGGLAAGATQGGTFTITNHGVTGSLLGTPIINQPQSGILGIGTIAKRAIVRTDSSSLLPSADDAIVIRPTCYLSFSFDHRVLDGAKADAFLSIVKRHLENW